MKSRLRLRLLALATFALSIFWRPAGARPLPPGAAGNPVEGPGYFAKINQVLQHPRCLNCHGAINPFEKEAHQGGQYKREPGAPGARCDDCHSLAPKGFAQFKDDNGKMRAMSEWRIPPVKLFFVDRSPTELCRQIRDAASDYEGLVAHFARDPRIQLAFEGRRAMEFDPITAETMKPEPPDMSYADFKQAGHDWWTRGAAACGFTGTVTVEVTDDFSMKGYGTTHSHETIVYHLAKSGRVTFDGAYVYDAKLEMGLTMIIDPGNVQMNWVDRFAMNADGTGKGDGALDVTLDKDGNYAIDYHAVSFLVKETATGYAKVSVNGQGETQSGSESSTENHEGPEGGIKDKTRPGTGHLEGTQKTVNDLGKSKPAGFPDLGMSEVVTTNVTWSLDLD